MDGMIVMIVRRVKTWRIGKRFEINVTSVF